MASNPRMQIIEEMMQERVQSVSAERVAVYYKRLEHIPHPLRVPPELNAGIPHLASGGGVERVIGEAFAQAIVQAFGKADPGQVAQPPFGEYVEGDGIHKHAAADG